MRDAPTARVSRRTLLQATAAGAAALAVEASPAPSAGLTALAQGDPVQIRWEFRGNPEIFATAQGIIEETFHAENPDIRVTMERAPDTERDERLLTAMVAGTAPDVFETWGDNVTRFADRDQVVDVEPLVERDFAAEDIEDFLEWQWRDFVLPSGLRFGVPKYVNVMMLWANVDLFEAAGQELPTADWTHDEYAEAARALANVTGSATDVAGLRIPMWSWDRYWYRVEMFGGQPVNPEDRTECLLNSAEAQEALEWVRALEWDERVVLQPLAIGQITDNPLPLFAAQKFAMNEDGFYPIETYAAVNEGFRYQYSEVPQGPVSRRVLGTTDGFAMYAGSQQLDAAWELAKFLSGPVYQERQVLSTGLLPGRVSVLDRYEELLLAERPELEAVNLQAGMDAAGGTYAGSRVQFVEDAAAREIIEPALQSLYASGSNPTSYFTQIAEEVTADQRERAG